MAHLSWLTVIVAGAAAVVIGAAGIVALAVSMYREARQEPQDRP